MNGETVSDLTRLFADLYKKTGIAVRLEPEGGEETEFSLDYCGEKIPAYLEGRGASAESAASLVNYLVGSVDFRQLLPDREEYLRNILLGEGGGWYIYRFMTKYNLSDGPCYCIEILPESRVKESLAHIENCLADSPDLSVCMDEKRIAVVRFAEDVPSPVEFAQFLCQSLYEELGVRAKLGIGCDVKSFTEIALSYSQAATAMRMSGILKSKGDVHTYREYLLVKMLEDLPEWKLKEYMEQFHVLGAGEIFTDEEMTVTAEEFLENSLNISETSRNLYMHRNTLMYRLDKIERITGLNIRKFSDAVTFRVVTILYKLLS